MDAFEILLKHPASAIAGGALCAFISLCLIARLWVVHRRDGFVSKLVWSFILLLPLFGWVLFGGFYRPPVALDWTGHVEYGRGGAGQA